MSDFTERPDLACDACGGAAIACSDEFFAEKDNLVRAAAPVWKDHLYTDRGKWMDGWETRRYRPADGVAPGPDSDVHDWCVVRLGMPGRIRGVVVDTAWFRGNYPASCAVSACELDDPLDLRALDHATWTTLVARSPLQGDAKNPFEINNLHRYTHVRLDIYPDGGVARLRVHGDVASRGLAGLVDLAALEHGAWVESCSDMFFGSRGNLIKPGPPIDMSDGWETRRRRGPGNDWAIVRLAATGTIERLELDTTHFKGNAPARCTVEGDGRLLLASPLQPHTRHVFEGELRRIGPVSHLKLSVFPDGGVARLRAWGHVEAPVAPGVGRLNAMTPLDATTALVRVCGSVRWTAAMVAARPFEDAQALQRIAERSWWTLDESDFLQAFQAHPKIGASGGGAWSKAEQAGAVASPELAEANHAYEAKHGFIYIVCASGRTADAMLAELHARLGNPRAIELRTAAEEQAKITRLRLTKLLQELA